MMQQPCHCLTDAESIVDVSKNDTGVGQAVPPERTVLLGALSVRRNP